MSLGLDNFNTRFESLYSPMGNIQANYNIGGGYLPGYPSGMNANIAPGSGYGYGIYGGYGNVVDPLISQRTREAVIKNDQHINNYHGRPIPADVPSDDMPTILGILGTALGSVALAIAAFRTRNKNLAKTAAKNTKNTANNLKHQNPAATQSGNNSANASNKIKVYKQFRPYVQKPVTYMVDPSTLRYAPVKPAANPVTPPVQPQVAPPIQPQVAPQASAAAVKTQPDPQVKAGLASIIGGLKSNINQNMNTILAAAGKNSPKPPVQSMKPTAEAAAIKAQFENISQKNTNNIRTAYSIPNNSVSGVVEADRRAAHAIRQNELNKTFASMPTAEAAAIKAQFENISQKNTNNIRTAYSTPNNSVSGVVEADRRAAHAIRQNELNKTFAINPEKDAASFNLGSAAPEQTFLEGIYTPESYAAAFSALPVETQQKIFHSITDGKTLSLDDIIRSRGIELPENVAKQLIEYVKSNIK